MRSISLLVCKRVGVSRPWFPLLLFISCLALALLPVACGGDGGPSGSPPVPVGDSPAAVASPGQAVASPGQAVSPAPAVSPSPETVPVPREEEPTPIPKQAAPSTPAPAVAPTVAATVVPTVSPTSAPETTFRASGVAGVSSPVFQADSGELSPSPREILEAMDAAMEGVWSVRFLLEMSLGLEGQGEDVPEEHLGFGMIMEGDFQAPDRVRFTVSALSQGGDREELELEMIVIGDDAYQRNPVTGEWEVDPSSGASLGDPMGLDGLTTGFASESLGEFSLVGEEELDGVPVHHLRGVATGEVLTGLLGADMTGGEGQVEYWVGREDSLLRRSWARFSLPLDEFIAFGPPEPERAGLSMLMEARAELSGYGDVPDIQPPDLPEP